LREKGWNWLNIWKIKAKDLEKGTNIKEPFKCNQR